jgi:hypothetical protein
MSQDAVSAVPTSGYVLPKSNWPSFVESLERVGLVFSASLAQSKAKALQNRDHINGVAFDILLDLNIAVLTRGGSIASKSDAAKEPLFGLASVSQVKDPRIGRAHMLSITPDLVMDIDSWGFKSLQQRYPNKKVGHPNSEIGDSGHPIKSIFLIGMGAANALGLNTESCCSTAPLYHDLLSGLTALDVRQTEVIRSPQEHHYCFANRVFPHDVLFVNPSSACLDGCPQVDFHSILTIPHWLISFCRPGPSYRRSTSSCQFASCCSGTP